MPGQSPRQPPSRPPTGVSASGGTGPARRHLRLGDLSSRHPTTFDFQPDAPARAAMAEALGIGQVKKLRLEGVLHPEGRRDWRLEARLGATAVQDCVVTLEPVTTRVDVEVLRHYLADLPAPDPVASEVEIPEDDSAEPLPDTLDLGALAEEALALALPDYPRAEGVEPVDLSATAPGAAPLTDAQEKPFARLEALKDKLTRGTETPED